MAFREVRVFEVREVLRLWLGGEGFRAIERLVGLDRKTVRRYVDAAVELGLGPRRRRGAAERRVHRRWWWRRSARTAPTVTARRGGCWPAHHDQIAAWVDGRSDGGEDPRAVGPAWGGGAVADGAALRRSRCAAAAAGRGPTVRVADGEPGDELQVDFGRMGLIFDPATGRRPGVQALIFTAVLLAGTASCG